MPNRFFIWRLSDDTPRELAPGVEATSAEPSDIRYHCGVLRELNQLLGDGGLTFLMTWHLDRFDEKFNDSIVLLIGDEMYQTPSYASKAKAVFKTGGVTRNSFTRTMKLPWSVAWRNLLRDLRNDVTAMRRHVNRWSTPMFEIPLGYHKLVDVSEIPFEQRTRDVFFAGALASSKQIELRPSIAARRQMMKGIDRAMRELPDRKFDCSLQPLKGKFTPQEYSHNLMNAKIVLCPRGNFDETFRFFEAARSGCVIVTEPLPDRWYYDDAPVVQLRGWSELSDKLRELFADPNHMLELSRSTKQWWERRASEPAVANYMVKQITSLGARG
jgi:hypothetical protein